MKHIYSKLLWILIGSLITIIFLLIFRQDSILVLLKSINDNYSSILNVLLTFILVATTLVYVILTNKIAKSSHESVKEAQNQLSLSKVPVLMPEVIDATGTDYFGDERRQLHVKVKVKNIGDSPAIKIYAQIMFEYKHVEFEYYDELYEYTFIGNIGTDGEIEAEMHFETVKIEKMIEDLTIRHAKNSFRVKNNPRQSAYQGPDLKLRLIYSNVHNQYFETEYITEILSLDAFKRKDEKDRYIFWFSDKKIEDNEPFKLMFKNPIFDTLEFNKIDKEEADKLAMRYKELI